MIILPTLNFVIEFFVSIVEVLYNRVNYLSFTVSENTQSNFPTLHSLIKKVTAFIIEATYPPFVPLEKGEKNYK